ncbi:hypothetical protein [Bosea minatitlanensis]|uniref:LysR substrate-binding domain-containing protein n=1 Tax=Bosea minatitlanensis TaxID=128782 RepID=A0ABW0F4Z9_9HYPH|nr:hypothetical protein [Bosea minatitlanensis]MCT4493445.1 hypothetical protein [Bosea minatitlanensis]
MPITTFCWLPLESSPTLWFGGGDALQHRMGDAVLVEIPHSSLPALVSRSVSPRPAISAALECNDGQVIRQAAIAGLGILIQPLYIVQADIEAGGWCQFCSTGNCRCRR